MELIKKGNIRSQQAHWYGKGNIPMGENYLIWSKLSLSVTSIIVKDKYALVELIQNK